MSRHNLMGTNLRDCGKFWRRYLILALGSFLRDISRISHSLPNFFRPLKLYIFTTTIWKFKRRIQKTLVWKSLYSAPSMISHPINGHQCISSSRLNIFAKEKFTFSCLLYSQRIIVLDAVMFHILILVISFFYLRKIKNQK